MLTARDLAEMAEQPAAEHVAALVAEVHRQRSLVHAARRVVAGWRNVDHPEIDRPGQLVHAMLAARTDEMDAALNAVDPGTLARGA